jgi:gamma-glutamylcyclotransferase
MVRYFAYGSNMLQERMKKRVSSARYLETATLAGYVLRFNKISKDGSSKANIVRSDRPGAVVWGVLFELEESERVKLDKAEGLGRGYDLVSAQVQTASGFQSAFTYSASPEALDDNLKPYLSYKRMLLRGAKQNHLPDDYIRSLHATKAVEDPAGR